MKNIAIIPARSGSKGLKNKNIKEFLGKPLLAYSIEVALNSQMFDIVFVSTDSAEYASIAKSYGADVSFLRNTETSSDMASSWDVVHEVIEKFEDKGKYFEKIMLLQPTSPLRNVEDIKRSFYLMDEKQANAIISVVEMEHSPLWSNILPEDGCMDNFIRKEFIGIPRQLLPKYYRINGAIYLLNREELNKQDKDMFKEKCYSYIMPQDRSIDIDTEIDFKLAEIIMEKYSMYDKSLL